VTFFANCRKLRLINAEEHGCGINMNRACSLCS